MRNSLMTSPPRAGMTLLKPYAAMYAPQTRRHWIGWSGYAARRTLKYARERIVRYSPKNVSPMSSETGRISARRPKKSPTAPKKFAMSSPIAAMGTDLGYGPPEPEQVPHLRIAQRRDDEVRLAEVDPRERRHADDRHAGGLRGADAGLRVLERDALGRVGAELRRRLEVDVRSGLRMRDVVAAHDGREAVEQARRPEGSGRELPARVRRETHRHAALEERVDEGYDARHRLDAGAVELAVDELAQLGVELGAAPRLVEVALHRQRRLRAGRAEHLALVVERELGAVARIERGLGARPRVLGVERQAVVVEDHRHGHAAAHDGGSAGAGRARTALGWMRRHGRHGPHAPAGYRHGRAAGQEGAGARVQDDRRCRHRVPADRVWRLQRPPRGGRLPRHDARLAAHPRHRGE